MGSCRVWMWAMYGFLFSYFHIPFSPLKQRYRRVPTVSLIFLVFAQSGKKEWEKTGVISSKTFAFISRFPYFPPSNVVPSFVRGGETHSFSCSPGVCASLMPFSPTLCKQKWFGTHARTALTFSISSPHYSPAKVMLLRKNHPLIAHTSSEPKREMSSPTFSDPLGAQWNVENGGNRRFLFAPFFFTFAFFLFFSARVKNEEQFGLKAARAGYIALMIDLWGECGFTQRSFTNEFFWW